MSLASDLLTQAKFLASLDRGRPKQASLRRSISTAYYSLFHLLLQESSFMLAPGSLAIMQPLVTRSINHSDIKKVARWFAGPWGNLPDELKARCTNPIPADLALFADTFSEMQHQRHEADYNIIKRFRRSESQKLISDTEAAMLAWSRIRRSEEAKQFLLCLIITDRWKR